jgi:protein gp37
VARKSGIEWLEGGASWNWLYGCTKIAQGCTHCYAERVVPRVGLRAVGPLARDLDGETMGATYRGQVIVRQDHLEDPLGWKKPIRIFVNSLSDTYHDDVPDELLDRAHSVMDRANWHTYLELTKRPERMARYLSRAAPRPHVWAGYSAATQKEIDAGWLALRATPARIRFLSLEPLVEEVDVTNRLDGIGWVIVGGESGRLARPCQEKWVRKVVKACKAAGVPVFVKQMGAWWAHELGLAIGPNRLDTKGNQMYAWPDDIQVREVPREG